ncbi:UNVERIFIED_CONTAM: Peptide methionine sulfoxide reductase B3 [Sesamum radiatum]|uniref:Peptide methionine sulfoxide reductase B3 n=1 Tax=Sesamum radiatum TaxID=300843 RepID=A0AAW2U6R5_SESRA
MGSYMLKSSPFASSPTLIMNPRFLSTPIETRFFHTSISKPASYSSGWSSGVRGLSQKQSSRSFRTRVVAMAATGPVHKSEEEWRAILSPEQFRILRQKGTE